VAAVAGSSCRANPVLRDGSEDGSNNAVRLLSFTSLKQSLARHWPPANSAHSPTCRVAETRFTWLAS